MATVRPQWPHTVDDIAKALDGVWGVVGAISPSGKLLRLERSLKAPTTYTLVEYVGADDSNALREMNYPASAREEAIKVFAEMLGFSGI